jgi:hypothetical protein
MLATIVVPSLRTVGGFELVMHYTNLVAGIMGKVAFLDYKMRNFTRNDK